MANEIGEKGTQCWKSLSLKKLSFFWSKCHKCRKKLGTGNLVSQTLLGDLLLVYIDVISPEKSFPSSSFINHQTSLKFKGLSFIRLSTQCICKCSSKLLNPIFQHHAANTLAAFSKDLRKSKRMKDYLMISYCINFSNELPFAAS